MEREYNPKSQNKNTPDQNLIEIACAGTGADHPWQSFEWILDINIWLHKGKLEETRTLLKY